MKFLLKLQKALDSFDLKEAVTLSDEIHEAEASGYKVTLLEDRLWGRLTAKILEATRGK